MERTYIKDLSAKGGQIVFLQGWVQGLRGQSKIKFLQLRDITGVVQCVAFDASLFDSFSKLMNESVVSVTGLVKPANIKSDEVTLKTLEVEIKELEIINLAEVLPFNVTEKDQSIVTELNKRLDYRYLDLHRSKIQSIFKIQSTIMTAFREFMINEEKALEAAFPSIIGSSSEGGTELFSAQYFEKKAYLSQSCQLYKQMLACSMEKVFTIFTVWRAEKHNTPRHLNEARQLDFEMAFADEFTVMQVLAKSVQHIVKKVIELNSEDLARLGVKLKVPEVKYMTFTEVAEIMKKEKIGMPDYDLSGEAEHKLGQMYPDTIVFVHDWPEEGRGFYIMPKLGKHGEKLSHGFDAIYKGIEISSGGQRVHLPELLIERLKSKDLNPKDFEAYINSFRYGAPPHGGFGIGLERLTMIMLELDNIREAVLFPRDRDRLTP